MEFRIKTLTPARRTDAFDRCGRAKTDARRHSRCRACGHFRRADRSPQALCAATPSSIRHLQPGTRRLARCWPVAGRVDRGADREGDQSGAAHEFSERIHEPDYEGQPSRRARGDFRDTSRSSMSRRSRQRTHRRAEGILARYIAYQEEIDELRNSCLTRRSTLRSSSSSAFWCLFLLFMSFRASQHLRRTGSICRSPPRLLTGGTWVRTHEMMVPARSRPVAGIWAVLATGRFGGACGSSEHDRPWRAPEDLSAGAHYRTLAMLLRGDAGRHALEMSSGCSRRACRCR